MGSSFSEADRFTRTQRHSVRFPPSAAQECFPFDLTDLREGQDQERTSTAGFNDDRQELWVDGAEGAVPRHLGDTDVIVGLLSLDRLAKDVAKLTLPHNAATHG